MRLVPAIACSVALLALAMPTSTAQSGCTDTTPNFTDTCHHEYLLYNVDQGEVDILILPAADHYAMRDAEILLASVQMWDTGINDLGPAWLANNLNLHPYRVGIDNVPPEALSDPEVIITTGEFNPYVLFGIGLQAPTSVCHNQPWPLMVNTVPLIEGFHQHADSPVGSLSMKCNGGGDTCFVINTNFYTGTQSLANMRDMFDLNSHELGHCIGIGHVGDALDFTASAYPRDDIMSYESDGWEPSYVLCVSTLNILALQHVYGHMFGQSGYPVNPAGGYVHQAASAWSDDNCTDPANHPWDDFSPLTEGEVLGSLPLPDLTCMVDAVLNNLLIGWPGPLLDCLV